MSRLKHQGATLLNYSTVSEAGGAEALAVKAYSDSRPETLEARYTGALSAKAFKT